MRILILGLFLLQNSCHFEPNDDVKGGLLCGADRTELYFENLTAKNFAVVANQSSKINSVHIVDSLLSTGFIPKKIFTPEHGFRGQAEAGAEIENSIDKTSSVEIVSLYGRNKKPSAEDLKDVEVLLFDLQDVGARFYTYISTLHYVMEACAENNVKLIILDRPNPNGDIVDGPTLEMEFSSFVGMHSIPVLHGMTIGEYAKMILGEKWLNEGIQCNLEVIPCQNYSHADKYIPPVKPSPNLPNYQSIRLYPSLCFFELTAVSIGRGTDFPFQVYGHPDYDTTNFVFTPESRPGASENPKHKGKFCGGVDLRNEIVESKSFDKLELKWLIQAYSDYPEKNKFFTSGFERLAGTKKLQMQIEAGMSEGEIRQSWHVDLEKFKLQREKYLIYP